MNNPVDMGQLLEFDIAFPGEEPLAPEAYLKGGSKNFILTAATFLYESAMGNSV